MLEKRGFWLSVNVLTLMIHLTAAILLLRGADFSHPLILIWSALLLVHVLEIPMSVKAIGTRPINVLVILGNTLLFGFAWWMPVRLGVFGPSPIQR